MLCIRIVVGLIGMPGSGKSAMTKYLMKKGFNTFEMGDLVRRMMRDDKIKITNISIREYSNALRKKYGKDIIARKSLAYLKKLKGNIVISGIRSVSEIRYFKKNISCLVLIAITAPKRTRFERLKNRGRADDPKTIKEFNYREDKETALGVPKAIKMADVVISNSGSLKEFKKNIDFLLERLAKN